MSAEERWADRQEWAEEKRQGFGDERIEARWVIDSETGDELLLDLETGKILARRDRNGVIYDRPS